MHSNKFTLIGGLFLLALAQTINAKINIERWQTQQSGQVYYIHAQGLPLVDVRIVFDAGSARDGDKFGIAGFTSALLEAGAGNWNADMIAQRFESVGAIFNAGIANDTAWLALRSLSQQDLFAQAISTLNSIIVQPTLSDLDFVREQKRILATLRHRAESPSKLAHIAFMQALYGKHPYAHPKAGFLSSIAKITKEDVRDFHQQFYVASNAIIVIVGDLDRIQAENIAEQLLRGLPKGIKPKPLPLVVLPVAGKTQHIDFPSQQTHILSGMPSINSKDKDYFALIVGNHILGGSGLVSKIFGEIREKRGLAYSAYSYFAPKIRKGPFVMGLQTRKGQAQEALDILHQTLSNFIKKGPTVAELEAAKKNIVGGFALRFDTNKKLTKYIAMIASNQLPLDYLDNYQSQVLAVSKEEIQRAFKRQILPDLLQTITLGSQPN